MTPERRRRVLRSAVWTLGALTGGAMFVGILLLGWDTDTIPAWAGLVATVGTLLTGDLAERTVPYRRAAGPRSA